MINRMIKPARAGSPWTARTSATAPVNALRRSMGYVIQHAGLFPHRTIVENIATVPRLLRLGPGRKARSRGDGADGKGRPRPRARPALPVPALRRPTAARRRRPRARRDRR